MSGFGSVGPDDDPPDTVGGPVGAVSYGSDGARGVVQTLMGHRAKQKRSEAPHPTCSDHEQVSTLRLFEQCLGRLVTDCFLLDGGGSGCSDHAHDD
ncbi:MAG: hypothetical protein AB7V43_16430 [Acidimicrobiia bacterium]